MKLRIHYTYTLYLTFPIYTELPKECTKPFSLSKFWPTTTSKKKKKKNS